MDEITNFELYCHGEKRTERGNWKTNIGILNVNEVPKIKDVCDRIKEQDGTFDYEIKKTHIFKFVELLVLYSDTESMAHNRGLWFVKKMRDARVADYYWVKEIPTYYKAEIHEFELLPMR